MIYYYQDSFFSLSDYGIQIPLHNKYLPLIQHVVRNYKEKLNIVEGFYNLEKEELLLAHTSSYVNRLLNGSTLEDEVIKSYELKNRDGSFNRYTPTKRSLAELGRKVISVAASVVDCAVKVKESRELSSFFIGGGMHHARSGSGGGFCLINDVVLAFRTLQDRKLIKNGLVIDVDAHFGDGTAEITANDSTIDTLSIHMRDGWPFNSETYEVKEGSTFDLPVSESDDYLKRLEDGLSLIDKKYSFAIVVQGADPFEGDSLEGTSLLKLTEKQMLDRDMQVYNYLKR